MSVGACLHRGASRLPVAPQLSDERLIELCAAVARTREGAADRRRRVGAVMRVEARRELERGRRWAALDAGGGCVRQHLIVETVHGDRAGARAVWKAKATQQAGEQSVG